MATNARMRGTGIAAVVGLAAVGWGAVSAPPAAARGYAQVSLVADTPGMAAHTDLHLLNAWGMTFDAAQQGPLTVADNHAGVVTAYDPTGQTVGSPVAIPKAAAKPNPIAAWLTACTSPRASSFARATSSFTRSRASRSASSMVSRRVGSGVWA